MKTVFVGKAVNLPFGKSDGNASTSQFLSEIILKGIFPSAGATLRISLPVIGPPFFSPI